MSALARLKPYGQLLAAALVALLGLGIAATALGHLFDPQHIGMWSGPQAFFFGQVDDAFERAANAHQLPGSTLYIVTVMVVGICWFVSRELFGYARAGLKNQAE
jgi:hypothetical protein